MNSVKIIEADLKDPRDIKSILHLLNEYASDIMGGGNKLSEFVQQNLIAGLYKKEGTIVLLAYDNNVAAGLSIGFEGFSTFYARPLINIHDLVVSVNFRGKGIAKLMLDKIEAIAIQRNCCKLTLEVLEGNKRAQKIYKEFGFAGYELDEQMGKALFLDKKL